MIRVAVFNDPQVCFGSDGLLVGLWENEDIEVSEWNCWQHLRGGADMGYDLPGEPGRGMTATPGYLNNSLPQNPRTKEYILENAKSFDLFVLLSYREYALRGINEFLSLSGLSPQRLFIICADGEDHGVVGIDIVEEYYIKVYFKRELVKGKMPVGWVPGLQSHLFPLPFSAFTRSYPTDIDDQEKELDIFLSLGMTYPARMTLAATLLDYAEKHKLKHWIALEPEGQIKEHPHYDTMKHRLQWPDYIRMQAQAKVGASIRGWGTDALHAWELFSFETAALYCEPEIYIPYPFRANEHYLPFREDCLDLPRQLDRLFHEEEFRKQIARAGKEHCLTYHSNQARARFMVDLAMKVKNGERIRTEEFGVVPLWTP